MERKQEHRRLTLALATGRLKRLIVYSVNEWATPRSYC